MKAMVFNGPRQILYQDYPDPVLTEDHEVMLAVSVSTICGSDLHIYRGEIVGRTDYGAGVDPFCVGHEFIGTVLEKGSAVTSFDIGDRVAASASLSLCLYP